MRLLFFKCQMLNKYVYTNYLKPLRFLYLLNCTFTCNNSIVTLFSANSYAHAMNFLAHLYLSGTNEQLLIGNFIADHVKGNDFKKFETGIQKGILLHRHIDAFTDSHPVVEKSKARLRNNFHKYTPVITDMYYDHFLAADWDKFHDIPLEEYTQWVYQILKKNEQQLPERTQKMLRFMVEHNWLLMYATTNGLQRVLSGMSQRASFKNKMDSSVNALIQHYSLFKNEFELFFDDLVKHVKNLSV